MFLLIPADSMAEHATNLSVFSDDLTLLRTLLFVVKPFSVYTALFDGITRTPCTPHEPVDVHTPTLQTLVVW